MSEKWARATRTNRTIFRRSIQEHEQELERLERRDLSSEARDEERARLRHEFRDAFLKMRHKSENCCRVAEEELRSRTPGALRRRAAWQNPGRFGDLSRMLEHVPDAELARYAELAVEDADLAGARALEVAIGGRPELDPEVARNVRNLLRQLDGGDGGLVHALTVARSELAGLALDYAHASGEESALIEAGGLAHAAARVEVDGETRRLDDDALAAAYSSLGLERAVELGGKYPDPVQGTWVQPPATPEPAA